MRPGEGGAARGLALIAHRRAVFAQIDGVGRLNGVEGGRQWLRRDRIAARRNAHVKVAQIDAGVPHAQVFEHGHGDEAEGGQAPVALEQAHGFRAARGHFVEALHEPRIAERRVAFGGARRGQRVAEEFVIAEEIRRGLLIVVGGPASVVVLKVGFSGVGKVGGVQGDIVVELHEIVRIGELVVGTLFLAVLIVLILIVVVLAAVIVVIVST